MALLSKHYALLTPVAEALVSLLFPFRWQGLFIPIMPYAMLDILDSPVPFLLGLHSRYLKDVPSSRRPRGVVFVDLDNDVVHLGYDDENVNLPRVTPSLPEKDALKLRSKLVTFAAPAYLLPDKNQAGTIVYGDDLHMPYLERETYARMQPENVHSRARRRDLFNAVDKAYTDNEVMQPMTGFTLLQGQYQSGDSARTSEPSRRRFRHMLGIKKRQASTESATGSEEYDQSSDDEAPMESLLDLHDVKGFSTSEIRGAFLRFFVSIMRDYRTFMQANGFNADAFVANLTLSPGNRNFVYNMSQTQLFQRFVQERRESPRDPECLFFDESINAKMNRSRFANLGRGGRRETGFIDDKSTTFTDVFSPPPPSNLGIPDRTFQYGHFPDLDPSLFGKTRKPREWSAKTSTIRTLRSQSMVIPATGSPVKKGSRSDAARPASTPSSIRRSMKSVKTLEGAIEFLSLPFAVSSGTKDFSEKPSFQRAATTDDARNSSDPLRKSSNDFSTAEEVVMNARRKVSILLSIFVDFQAVSRGYLARHARLSKGTDPSITEVKMDEDAEARKTAAAAQKILSMVLIFRARRLLLQCRGAAILIQAVFRGRRAELIFGLIRQAVARFQARARGWLVRRLLDRLVAVRMKIYGPQLFALWKMANVSLAFRTNFWPYVTSTGLLGMGIMETEILRLVKEVNLPADDAGFINPELNRTIRECRRFGMNAQVLKLCILVEGNSSAGESLHASFSGSHTDGTLHHHHQHGATSSEAVGRVAAERTQIYEKLSTIATNKAEIAEKLYDTFKVPLKDKQRKVTLSNAVWDRFLFADESAKLVLMLFPELSHSTNIKFAKPSSKGRRRIRSSDVIPAPLDESLWSHTFMDRRVRKNLAEVASAAILYMPRRLPSSSLPVSQEQRSANPLHREKIWSQAVTSVQGHATWKQCRLQLMRTFVHEEKVKIPPTVPSSPRWPKATIVAPLVPPTTIATTEADERRLFPDLLFSKQ